MRPPPPITNSDIKAELAARLKEHAAKVAQWRAALRPMGKAPQAARPIFALAQGDSWFDYPLGGCVPFAQRTDMIALLPAVLPVGSSVVSLAHFGLATTEELGLSRQRDMISTLRNAANWADGKPDAILFSGGGDDICGDQFLMYLDYADESGSTGLNAERFAALLASVRASYLALFAFRDRYAPGVPIIGHAYDFAIPSGVAVAPGVGPWLAPALEQVGRLSQGRSIVKDALTRFNAMLADFEKDGSRKFYVARTQGLLAEEEWENELHPTPAGFAKMAKVAADAVAKALPTHFAAAGS